MEQEPTLLVMDELVQDWRARATPEELEHHEAVLTAEIQEGIDAVPHGPETAADFLVEAGTLIGTRGRDRDNDNGERSMARCVDAFNAMTGHELCETDGWLFMQFLKMARAYGGAYRLDDYMDDVAYAALKAECAVREFG